MKISLPIKYVKTSILWLLIAAIIGLFLRWQFVQPTSEINYTFFLHGHSHVMLLGWLFNAMMGLYSFYFLDRSVANHQKYKWIFWLFQLSILGMLIWFPIQGYKAFSIAFSSLHIFVSYGLVYFFWKDSRSVSQNLSLTFVNWGWFFHLISTLGPFALGIIMAKGLKEGPLDELAVYYYLHFQYNGLFIFAVLGIFFKILEVKQIVFDHRKGKMFLYMMVVGCLLGYSLSTLWAAPPVWVHAIAWLAAILKLLTLILLFQILLPIRKVIKEKLNPWAYRLFVLAGIAFLGKHLLQFFSAFEEVAMLAYQVRNYTIAYLHLVFLGILTLFFLGGFIQEGWIHVNTWVKKLSLQILIVGVLLTEIALVIQIPYFTYQAHLPNYFVLIFGVSWLILLGIGGLIFQRFYAKED